MTTLLESRLEEHATPTAPHVRLAPHLLDCLRCPGCSTDGPLVQDVRAHGAEVVSCTHCGSTYDHPDRILNLSNTAHSANPVFEQEFDDWEHNAEHYIHEPNSPLYQLLHTRKTKTFGITGCDAPIVLDLGAGTGYFSHYLANLGCHPVTLDFSPKMLQAGMKSYDLPAAVLYATPPLPFRSESFDAVIANGMLHHCKAQGALGAVLSEIHRVLKPGGMLYVFDRNGAWAGRCLHHFVLRIKELMQNRLTASASASRHEPDFMLDDLQSVLDAGFRIQRQRHISTLPTFATIVATNTLKYAGWPRLASTCQTLARPLLGILEQGLAARCFTVEQCLCLSKTTPESANERRVPESTTPRAVRTNRGRHT